VGYRGRIAPSPTGRLHLGTARTALVAWLRARAEGGGLVLRIEDLDPPRVVAGAAEEIVDDLRWLGLDWDEGPDVGGPLGPYVQSERGRWYREAIARLDRAGRVYRCTCSRKEVTLASSAPHGDLGPAYPGTCRAAPSHPGRPAALRFRTNGAMEAFVDAVHGRVTPTRADDFVVQRADGLYAYQLAVVVDDAAMGITEVVRGDDLLTSTPWQIALYRTLAGESPAFLHVPLVLGPDGGRLAKRHGAYAIADYRAAGWEPARVVGALAHTLGLGASGRERMPRDLVGDFEPGRLPTTPTVLDAAWLL
jgi:glutamyl-tRNA synthetase